MSSPWLASGTIDLSSINAPNSTQASKQFEFFRGWVRQIQRRFKRIDRGHPEDAESFALLRGFQTKWRVYE